MSIDILMWKFAGPLAAAWGWQTAPIKFMSKRMVEKWFKNKFVPVVVRGFINKGLSALRKIMWDLFKVAMSGSISASINKFLSFAIWEHIDIILSAGGFVAGFLDYITDGKLDKKIKIW